MIQTKPVLLALAVLLLLLGSLPALIPYRPQLSYSQVVAAQDGTVLHVFLSADDKWRMKTELREISPRLRQAFLAKEDRWFYYHPGVNPLAVVRALVRNTWQGRTGSGASTITMQVARLLEPKARTVPNKLLEMFRALQLEYRYSKDEILQLYLNLVPYGGNVEGVKAASVLYFGQLPQELSLAQVTALTVIPNQPTSLRIGRHNERIKVARDRWLKRFAAAGAFPQTEIADALAEPLEAFRREAPKLAPHYALRMRQRFRQANITGTLDAARQARVERITANYSKRLHDKRIFNASVLVINNQTGAVEAYVGSADFADNFHHGQVDGVRAVRSPGSTLKPYLYAIAFDKGLLTPGAVVLDVPVNFSGYSPENFDEQFHGPVTVEKALAFSLNMPAVDALEKLGVKLFTDKLAEAGFKQVRKDQQKLGLSTILGGCGTRLEELTHLFSAFAREGRQYPLRWQPQDPKGKPQQLISEGAAWMLAETLTQITRPDLPNHYESSLHVPKIAWKTGTSYGRRDAWSIGYNRHYTIGVWTGNFSGEGVPELTGADIATPLLFELFNALDYNSPNHWYRAPRSVSFRLVCAETGLLPEEHCTNQVMASYLPGTSAQQRCRHLQPVWLSADNSHTYCTTCRPEYGYRTQLLPNYAPQLISYYEATHLAYERVPPHNPRCTRVFRSHAPLITSPAHQHEYLVEKQEPQALQLTCSTPADVSQVYWYVNDRFYQAAPPTQPVFYTPTAGPLKVSCSDDQGRNSNVSVTVKWF